MPCVKRAKELENYDPNSEFSLGGDEEGWTATHNDPALPTPGGAHEDIPDIDGADAEKNDDDDSIPDIGELELEADDDEVGQLAGMHPEMHMHP